MKFAVLGDKYPEFVKKFPDVFEDFCNFFSDEEWGILLPNQLACGRRFLQSPGEPQLIARALRRYLSCCRQYQPFNFTQKDIIEELDGHAKFYQNIDNIALQDMARSRQQKPSIIDSAKQQLQNFFAGNHAKSFTKGTAVQTTAALISTTEQPTDKNACVIS